MSHFDELSQRIGTKVQKACRRDPTLQEVISDHEVLWAILDLIEHYKKMTYEEHSTTADPVSESVQPLPATKGDADTAKEIHEHEH